MRCIEISNLSALQIEEEAMGKLSYCLGVVVPLSTVWMVKYCLD